MKKKTLYLSVVGASLALVRCDCSQAVNSFFIPPSDEIELGRQFDSDLRSKGLADGERFLDENSSNADEKALVAYLDSLGSKIADKISDEDWDHLLPSGASKKNFFSFSIIKSKTENAFAVPGGYTYFYTAIMNSMKDESELVGVLGHEMGHVVMHHSRDRMIDAGIAQTLVGLLTGGEEGSALAQIAGALGATWWLNKNGQADELESDSIGVYLATENKVYPLGIAEYFGKGLDIDGEGNCVEKEPSVLESIAQSMSTHPPHCDRIAQANRLVKKLEDAGKTWNNKNPDDYKKKVKDRLANVN